MDLLSAFLIVFCFCFVARFFYNRGFDEGFETSSALSQASAAELVLCASDPDYAKAFVRAKRGRNA